ncbi:pilus assembly protein PilP [Pseudooceanicola sp. HF7]|uniref:pilus assembly protein PilP n=1 Tax=Pseudooceanicola sp. HF7 TaxID=2721560 RepID=UPI001430AB47|nr:pilus assembly protein PilP [Pseudooceanicola sp. HF7]NIZ09238.1 pilus assembly protein PilP [Pseudooceanicola sp. HF7]
MTQTQIAQHQATLAGQLPSGGITLVGTITGPRGPEAFLRTSNGRIRKVSAGDKLGFGGPQVLAVGNGQVRLYASGKEQILTMPGH